MLCTERPPVGGLSVLVAGPGIEPGPSGYEPDEVPLLHPAMYFCMSPAAERDTSPPSRYGLWNIPQTRGKCKWYTVEMQKIIAWTSRGFGAFLLGVLLATMWGFFAYRHVDAYRQLGEYALLLFATSETLQALFFLIRREVREGSADPLGWAAAVAGTFGPLLFRPSTTVMWGFASGLLIAGALFQIAGLLSLNRSFGIVPTLREVKTRGVYRFVRHPMYAAYFVAFPSYVLAYFSWENVVILAVVLAALLVRIMKEEAVLSKDERYRSYMSRVRFRLLPGVY